MQTAASGQPILTAEKPKAPPAIEVPEKLTVQALNQNLYKGNDNLVAEKARKAEPLDQDDSDMVLQLGLGQGSAIDEQRKIYNYIAYAGAVLSVLWVFFHCRPALFARGDQPWIIRLPCCPIYEFRARKSACAN